MADVNIKDALQKYTEELRKFNATLVPVSKTKPDEDLLKAYDAGNRIFGENKVQELVDKYERLPKDFEWHFIGHLQRNKVKYIAPFVSLIHAVDTDRLLKEINKQALRNDRVIDCLIQVYIATEEAKHGMSESELLELLTSEVFSGLNNIRIIGLMGMATNTSNQEQIRNEFRSLKTLFDKVESLDLPQNIQLKELSMGMSGDYQIALEEGSTMVRIGSAIFGARHYPQNG